MDLDLPAKTFNSYGGSSTFGLVLALVELSSEDFGSALQDIELTLYFRSSLPFQQQSVDPSLADLYAEHEVRCGQLPTRRFLRKKCSLRIEALAEFATGEEIQAIRPDFRLDWQHGALDVLISEVEACKRKFKSTDDFKVDEFLDWLRSLHEKLPTTQAAAHELDELWRRESDEQYEQLSDWEKLGIDWDDYHTNARDVVTDPGLWSTGHDFAPNGNDSGADVLWLVRERKSRCKKNGGTSLYKKLSRDWGFPADDRPDDPIEYNMRREVIVGLAFAFLKLFAYCPKWLIEKSVSEITHYQQFLSTHHLDWEHREECLAYQAQMLDCLRSAPTT